MKNKHQFIGLTDQQVLENRAKYGANVLTPAEEETLWQQIREVGKHWVSVTMYGLFVISAIVAGLLFSTMGAPILVMPAIVLVSSILLLVVGFFGGFEDEFFRILIVAFMLSMGISIYQFEWNNAEWTTFFEPIGIIVALVLATSIAYFLEKSNAKTFRSLNQSNDDTLVKVIRNGCLCQVPRMDIVVGDIVKLEAGEEVPADCELLDSLNLIVDESSLTGEPQASKSTNPNDYSEDAAYPSNEIKKGTNVVEGYCTSKVTKVGNATESGEVYRSLTEGNEVKVGWFLKDRATGEIIGKYATEDDADDACENYLAKHEDADVFVEQPLVDRMRVSKGCETPLSQKLNKLAAAITKTSYAFAMFIVIGRMAWFFVTKDADFTSFNGWISVISYLLDTIMIAVTLIVVAVPEGLPMSVTLSLAFSMRKLMKTNTLPRTMHACETMGAASVICTDKTGTLTKNQMEVVDSKLSSSDEQLLAEMIAVNTTANLDCSDNENVKVIGNPTEGALLLWLQKKGVDYLALRNDEKVIDRLPFTTENKYMATIVNSSVLAKKVVFVKGAPEILLEMSNVSIEEKSSYESLLQEYQSNARRTLGVAYAELSDSANIFVDGKLKANNLHFVGVFAILDDIREGVKESIAECMAAGIAVKIVTGDTPGTAKEIGRKIGLWTTADTDKGIITGSELSALTDKELEDRVLDLKIIARARPMDKKRLVEALQRLNQVVAVTGDGTNDAPALHTADVGLSMGNGTVVAKDASDMIIQDNSFSTITNAVMWGRSLYKNIQRFLLFQLTVNVSACFIVLFGAFIGTDTPLTVTQMLWVNLVMDTFAAVALASLPPSDKVMKEKPRNPGKKGDSIMQSIKDNSFILDRNLRTNILGVGGFFFLLLMVMMLVFKKYEVNQLTDFVSGPLVAKGGLSPYEGALFFTIFVMTHFFYLFNSKAYMTGKSAFANLKQCKGLLFIASVIFLGQVALTEMPGLQGFFNIVPGGVRVADWLIITAGSFLVLGVREVWRLFKK